MELIRPIDVLIVGAGMYVCGIGTDGYGTILPTVFESYRSGLVNKVTIVGSNPTKRVAVLEKVESLNKIMGLNVEVAYLPEGKRPQPDAYLEVASKGRYDCAIVSVPDHLHFVVTQDLLCQNLHCLVVKPLVATLNEAHELIRLQQERNVYCAVEFHKRFDETNLAMRKMLRQELIGDIQYMLVEYSQRKTIPLEHFSTWSHRTNIFQYLGVHYVDLIFYLTGAFPKRVMAVGQKNVLRSSGIDTYDSIQVMVEWNSRGGNGCFNSTLLTNWIDPTISSAMSDQKIKIIGTRGRIECDQKERGLRLIADGYGIQDLNPYFSNFRYNIDDNGQEFRGYGYESILQFLKDSQAIRNGALAPNDLGGLRATFQDARISVAVIEAVNASLGRCGKWADIDLTESLPRI